MWAASLPKRGQHVISNRRDNRTCDTETWISSGQSCTKEYSPVSMTDKFRILACKSLPQSKSELLRKSSPPCLAYQTHEGVKGLSVFRPLKRNLNESYNGNYGCIFSRQGIWTPMDLRNLCGKFRMFNFK